MTPNWRERRELHSITWSHNPVSHYFDFASMMVGSGGFEPPRPLSERGILPLYEEPVLRTFWVVRVPFVGHAHVLCRLRVICAWRKVMVLPHSDMNRPFVFETKLFLEQLTFHN